MFMSLFQLCFFLVIAFIYDPRHFRMQEHLGIVAFGGSLFQGSKRWRYKKLVRLRSLPATWMGFSVLDPVILHNSSWHKQYLPCYRVRFIRVQNTEKGLEKCSKHPPARFFFTFQFLLFSNTRRVLPYVLSYLFDLNIDHWAINFPI